jgi:hypothetical protein
MAWEDGSTPIRWVDLETGTVEEIIRARTRPLYSGPKHERRVDPHPAWDASFRYIVINACPGGRRTVLLADMSSLLV